MLVFGESTRLVVQTRRGSYRNVWGIDSYAVAHVFDNDKTLSFIELDMDYV